MAGGMSILIRSGNEKNGIPAAVGTHRILRTFRCRELLFYQRFLTRIDQYISQKLKLISLAVA